MGIGDRTRHWFGKRSDPRTLQRANDDQLRIARFAYEQVLDATKHQDDKIHRLLTAVAFLTSGALAVAALAGGAYLTRRFEFGASEVPLALITVGVFFVGVVATVLMLVGSLTTPLKLPGVPALARGDEPALPELEKVWASDDARASPIYFFEIARLSLGEWQTKWDSRYRERLVDEELGALVRETHNLAGRTAFKYTRTREAVAVLSFALASLALAAVLVLVAAGYQGSDSVPFGWQTELAVTVVTSGYLWLQLRTTLVHGAHTVDESRAIRAPRVAWARALFPILVAAVPALLIWLPSSNLLWAAILAAVLVAALITFRIVFKPSIPSTGRTVGGAQRSSHESRRAEFRRSSWLAALAASAYLMTFAVAVIFDLRGVNIAAAYGSTFAALGAALVEIAGHTKWRTDDYVRRDTDRRNAKRA